MTWRGREIESATGPWAPDPRRGSDLDQNPLKQQDQIIPLNETTSQQAEIIRRYRLFSANPDEMLTFMALAGMRGGNLDPRMYYYGGLWIYPVGALLKAGQALGYLQLRPDVAFYLDRPDEFGKFYIVARAYSAAWGVIGIVAVFGLVRGMTGRRLWPTAAGVAFALMPVVVNSAHEAKPHLAGAVLVLLTIQACLRYLETRKGRWWIIAAAMAGAAAGMVLWGGVAAVGLVATALVAQRRWPDRARVAAGGVLVATAVFSISNPFLLLNVVRGWRGAGGDAASSNLGMLLRSQTFSGPIHLRKALYNGVGLITEAGSATIMLVGAIAAGLFILRRARPSAVRGENLDHTWAPAGWLLAWVGVPSVIAFIAFATDKPGEYGRFAVLPATVLLIAAVSGLARWLQDARWSPAVALILVLLSAAHGGSYLAGFVEEASPRASAPRWRAAARLVEHRAHASTIGTRAEPAPFSVPPLDIASWRLLLLPRHDPQIWRPGSPDVIVGYLDAATAAGDVRGTDYRREVFQGAWPWFANRISWADKPFELLVKRGLPKRRASSRPSP